jgi:soluble lytic murein transglycosylase-like protein
MGQHVSWVMARRIAAVDHGVRHCLAPMKLLRHCWILLLSLCAAHAWADRQQDPELGKVLERAREAGECFEDRFDQQVWWAAMEPKLHRVLQNDADRAQILEHVHCEAKRQNLPPALVMAVIDVESKFDRWAVSSAGAVGLMQIMPFWPNKLGMSNAELVRIPQNIRMGCTILKFYLDREKGDYTKALARYNGSIGRRNYADLVLTRLANRWQYR